MLESDVSLSQDEVFGILSNARRRYVLYYLQTAGEPVKLGVLADELAAWENDTTVDEITKTQRKRVQVSLYQTHIQKLLDAGLIEYDPDTRVVSLDRGTNHLTGYLPDEQYDDQTHWKEMYIGLGVVSVILFLLVTLNVAIFASMSPIQLGIVIIAVFGVLAMFHAFRARRNESNIPVDILIRN